MKRELSMLLIGGCAVILVLDLPVFFASIAQDLRGAYPVRRAGEFERAGAFGLAARAAVAPAERGMPDVESSPSAAALAVGTRRMLDLVLAGVQK